MNTEQLAKQLYDAALAIAQSDPFEQLVGERSQKQQYAFLIYVLQQQQPIEPCNIKCTNAYRQRAYHRAVSDVLEHLHGHHQEQPIRFGSVRPKYLTKITFEDLIQLALHIAQSTEFQAHYHTLSEHEQCNHLMQKVDALNKTATYHDERNMGYSTARKIACARAIGEINNPSQVARFYYQDATKDTIFLTDTTGELMGISINQLLLMLRCFKVIGGDYPETAEAE